MVEKTGCFIASCKGCPYPIFTFFLLVLLQMCEKIDVYVERARREGTYETELTDLRSFVAAERETYMETTAARNIGMTLVFVIIILGFMIFVMQVMTLADPFALFSGFTDPKACDNPSFDSNKQTS